MNQKFLVSLIPVVGTLIAILVVGALVQAQSVPGWNEPTAIPPNGNTPAPVNVGTIEQIKVGGFGTEGNIGAAGKAAFLGSVGVGTINPAFPFDIHKGVATVAKFGDVIPLYLARNWPAIGFNAYYVNGWKFGAGSNNNYAGLITTDPGTGKMSFFTTPTAGNEGFDTGMSERLNIDRSGNVGVGVNWPGYRLHVGGNIEATGDVCGSAGGTRKCLSQTGAAVTGGDITGVIAGAGLAGGGLSGDVTLSADYDNLLAGPGISIAPTVGIPGTLGSKTISNTRTLDIINAPETIGPWTDDSQSPVSYCPSGYTVIGGSSRCENGMVGESVIEQSGWQVTCHRFATQTGGTGQTRAHAWARCIRLQ